MFCPECGHDASEAKFCPECGNDLRGLKQTLRRPQGKPAAVASSKGQRPRAARRAAERRAQPTTPGRSRLVLWIWLGVAAIAAVATIFVFAGGQSNDGPGSGTAEPIATDTSGTYAELVSRANDLYDQGTAAFNNDDATSGEEYFRAAAEVYQAAWAKQPGDPNVGTDLAVSLFYARHHDEALAQIAAVLKKNPDFQTAHLNKGIFLQTEASETKDAGDDVKAAAFLAQAKAALEKAVGIDSGSEVGKRAADLLQSL